MEGGDCLPPPYDPPPPRRQVFLPRPALARGDGPIMRMRSWIAQFYARGLPKVALSLDAVAGEAGKEGEAGAAAEASSIRQRVAPGALARAAGPDAW